jgi:hypothetical protein
MVVIKDEDLQITTSGSVTMVTSLFGETAVSTRSLQASKEHTPQHDLHRPA